METDPSNQPTRANLDPTQTEFAQRIASIEENYRDTVTPKPNPYTGKLGPNLDQKTLEKYNLAYSEELVAAIKANPGEAATLGVESYSLLSFYLDRNIPSYNQAISIDFLMDTNDPEDLIDPSAPEAFKNNLRAAAHEIKEKVNLDNWALTDDERDYHTAVLDATGFSREKAPANGPHPVLTKRSKQKLVGLPKDSQSTRREDFSPMNIAPPPWQRIKAKYKQRKAQAKAIVPKKSDKDKKDTYVFSAAEKNRLSDPGTLAIAKAKAMALMELDDARRNKEAKKLALVADALGELGVRNFDQQNMFENAENQVREYNSHMHSREKSGMSRKTDAARGIGYITLRSDILRQMRKTEVDNRTTA